MTPAREAEIRKWNKVEQSFAVRDLLAEVDALRDAGTCTEDDPCECCLLNNEAGR